MKFFAKTAALAAAMLAGLPAASMANSTLTQYIPVYATVAPGCTLSTSALSFGTYYPFGNNTSSPLIATAPITVQCNYGSTPQLTIYGAQRNSVATPGSTAVFGTMINSNTALNNAGINYTFALDNPLNANPNSNTPATWTSGNAVTYTLTGTLQAGINAATGQYSDQLQANLTF